MPTGLGSLVLEKRHFDAGGLTGAETEAYAGMPVLVRTHTDFPHGEKILETGGSLSRHAVFERAAAMHAAYHSFRKKKAPTYCELRKEAESKGVAREEVSCFEEMAERKSCLLHRELVKIPYGFFDRVQNDTEGAFLTPYRSPKTGRIVFSAEKLYAGKILHEAEYPFLLIWPEHVSCRAAVALDLGLRLEQVKALPPVDETRFTKDRHLFFTLHELRHVLQIASFDKSRETAFLHEADADLFAHRTMACDAGAHPFLRTVLNIRYVRSLFVEDAAYLFAPLLEAWLGGAEERPSFAAVQKSMGVIQKTLMRECVKNHPDAAALLRMQPCTFLKYSYAQNPEKIFQPLRDLVGAKAFEAEAATQKLAARMVVAADALASVWCGSVHKMSGPEPA